MMHGMLLILWGCKIDVTRIYNPEVSVAFKGSEAEKRGSVRRKSHAGTQARRPFSSRNGEMYYSRLEGLFFYYFGISALIENNFYFFNIFTGMVIT